MPEAVDASRGSESASPRGEILLIGPLPPPVDGQSVAFQTLFRGLAARGFHAEVIDISPDSMGFEASRGRRLLEYLRVVPRTLSRCRRHRDAVVYLTAAQSLFGFFRDLMFVAVAFLTQPERQIVLHVHGGNYHRFYEARGALVRGLVRWMLGRASTIIVLSERLRDMFAFAPALRDRIAVAENGLPDELAPESQAKPYPLGPIRCLFLSNLIESKGYLELVEAVAILRDEHGLDVQCDLCGEIRMNPSDDSRASTIAEAEQILTETIERSGLEPWVRVRGTVQGALKESLLQQAHFFVLPTRYDAEGQPISIIEAMAYGCVVISTNYRGIPGMVKHGETGWLLETPDPRAIAEAIQETLADPERFPGMSAAAIAHYQRRFTSAAHVERMSELLFLGS